MISDQSELPTNHDIKQETKGVWSEVIPNNVPDYKVPGLVVFRCFAWMFVKFLTTPMFLLLEKVFFRKGLRRRLCTHEGSFYMVGPKQTNMASGSMCRPANEGTEHDYWDKNSMNTTLLLFAMPIINMLGEQASQQQNACGEILLNLLRVSLGSVGILMATINICIYNILTYCFFNTYHKDSDSMHRTNSNSIIELILNSKLPPLLQWLGNFQRLFGTNKRLPMPTTCCWSLVENSQQWTHKQYFILMDLMMAFDVSSDVFEALGDDVNLGQGGATFYGPLLDHCTSSPLWISKDGETCTVICPGNCYNFAWDKSGGDSPATKARKALERAANAIIRARDRR